MIAWHFIKWIFASILGKVIGFHGEMKYELNRHPAETTFFWVVCVLILSGIQMIIVGVIGWATNTLPSFWWVSGFTLTLFAHFVYTIFSVLFARFKRERAELFNTIKNS